MERVSSGMKTETNYFDAKRIMGDNIIGNYELSSIKQVRFQIPKDYDHIPFSYDEISEKKDDYLLILGCGSFSDNKPVTIRNLRAMFGLDPEINEPCFYNQDWYDKERFVDVPIKDGWFFIRKQPYESTRACHPDELSQSYNFPSAIRCTYSFFVSWLSLGIKLWYHDYIWCSDLDHSGDRIYVGKYYDIDGINKNGFSIHRYLTLKKCYACIE